MRAILVFLVSLIICIIAIVIERMVGIGWDYHPDVITYITTYKSVTEQGLDALPNQLYYFITNWVGGSVSLLIALNVLAYCTANMIIANVYYDFCCVKGRVKRKGSILMLVLLLFAPYRLHLAIHALKDTFIILSLCTFAAFNGRSIYSWLAWIPLLLLRIYAVFYTLILVRGRMLLIIIALAIVLIGFLDLPVLEVLQDRNEAGMHSREFDVIPSFVGMGLTGTILRMIVWPLLVVTGAYVILSPALLFIPLALEALVARVWSRHVFGHLGLTIGLIVCLAVIAAFVDSFTAYLRYVYPALVVMPIIIMRNMAHLPNRMPRRSSKSLRWL
ncbi:MAG: hypothetical protein AWT59_2857 [Candidatus Gallionella acididurans]|uniref:Glycosyltransferase RgtA/B/C/D-like domain-containing protein n=1 Tax=Candidatus Gallionella acididurans TaxID=1796491 RepID=A0A139BPT1_9PROT|nr:MAG: hypothetical protein AWT59_2857 [Candidatus Gallionella acididurans]